MAPSKWRLFAPAAAAVLLHVALLGLYLHKYDYDPSALVCASRGAAGHYPLEKVQVGIGPGGYDGMFYYALARNPWRLHLQEGIDAPAFRHSRLLYLAICWAGSGGDAGLLLWVMPLLNLAAIGGLAWLGAWYAQRQDLSPWWGLALPFVVNAAIPALRNLTDVLSTLFVCALLLAWLTEQRPWLLLVLALGAVLTREQNLAPVGLMLLAAGWQRRFALSAGLAAVLAVWLGWIGLVWAGYGVWPYQGGGCHWQLPGQGYAYAWTHLGGLERFSTRLACFNALSLAQFTVAAGLGVAIAFWKADPLVRATALAAVVMALLASPQIWNDLISYRRAFVWLPLGVWLAAVQLRRPAVLWTLLPAGLFSVGAALRYV
jgi:hypothetical protein